jgi:ankyrin repeat protein
MKMERIVQLLGGLNVSRTRLQAGANAHVWHVVLAAVVNKTLNVDAAYGGLTLLHLACYHGEVDVVRQLLALHANPSRETRCNKYRPMHYAAMSDSANALAICKLLPVADLASLNTQGRTPLVEALSIQFSAGMDLDLNLFQWMIQQPQFDVSALVAILYHAHGKDQYVCLLDAEVAARSRWTPARAAWCATACVCA